MRKNKLYFGKGKVDRKVLGWQKVQAEGMLKAEIELQCRNLLGDTPFRVIMGNYDHSPTDWSVEVKTYQGYAWLEGDSSNLMDQLLQYSTHPLEDLAPVANLEYIP